MRGEAHRGFKSGSRRMILAGVQPVLGSEQLDVGCFTFTLILDHCSMAKTEYLPCTNAGTGLEGILS